MFLLHHHRRFTFGLLLFLLWGVLGLQFSLAQQVGDRLTDWQEGYLDIHHINTGKGESAFFIFPDGTTALVDAGDHARPPGPREVPARPDDSRMPGEWIARYIQQVMKHGHGPAIDYAILTHFDTDHIGGITDRNKPAPKGDYLLTGISQVASFIPIRKIIDRAWPDYNWPKPLTQKHILNYRKFVDWATKNQGLKVEKFQVGRNDQIKLLHHPERYPNFEIRNIVANGEIWRGEGSGTYQHFPPLETLGGDLPSENASSLGFKLTYGKFDYFTAGDLVGVPPAGSPTWKDIETPVAQAVGPVDVSIANHHAFIDAQNEAYIKTLQPRVTIIQSWVAAHPAHSTLSRLLSTQLYPGERDIFTTNLKDETKVVIGGSINQLKSQQGHIVIRVSPGGEEYRIFVLDDTSESFKIKSVHGPYRSR